MFLNKFTDVSVFAIQATMVLKYMKVASKLEQEMS